MYAATRDRRWLHGGKICISSSRLCSCMTSSAFIDLLIITDLLTRAFTDRNNPQLWHLASGRLTERRCFLLQTAGAYLLVRFCMVMIIHRFDYIDLMFIFLHRFKF